MPVYPDSLPSYYREMTDDDAKAVRARHDRREISADIRYLVKHLWIISVGVPVAIGLIIALLASLR